MHLIRDLLTYWKIRRSGHFDLAYYLAQGKNTERIASPIWHYVTRGWKEGLNPHPGFDTRWYVNAYPDVRRSSDKLNPFLHFLEHGYGEARQSSPSGVTYQDWISACERYDDRKVAKHLRQLNCQPLISVIVPVYKPNIQHLQACIASVRDQQYENWELCLSDDASGDPQLDEMLCTLAADEPRVKVVFNRENGNISRNSNRALKLAGGDYIALVDQDDLLGSHALYEVVCRLNENPRAKIVYSDEDKIDNFGIRSNPHFKPDWNLDLLYSTNYVSHLGVYDHTLIKRIGGFRVGYDGSQDYDLLLRASSLISDAEIEHIPKVLYHWRASEGSTAGASTDKSYTWTTGENVLRDFIGRQGLAAEILRGPFPNTFRLVWLVQDPIPRVSIIIPTRDGGKVLRKCVDSILNRTDYSNFEILIVDNQSSCKETLEYLNELTKRADIRVVVFDEAFNFSRIVNYGVQHCSGEVIGLINDDVEVISPGWLTEMVGLCSRQDVGCVGAKLYYPDNTIQHGGVILGINGVASHAHKHFPQKAKGYFGRLVLTQQYSAVTAACMLVRRHTYTAVGGFDEDNLPIAFNDLDFCLKIGELGKKIVWTPWAEFYHHESYTRGYEDTPEKLKRFNAETAFIQNRWKSQLSTDKAYSINLSSTEESFHIEIPTNI